MKPIKTLDELKKELMSENGAVFLERFRYRLINNHLHIFSIVENTWRYSGSDSNHGFLFEIGKWFYYEKPKKIAREERWMSEKINKETD